MNRLATAALAAAALVGATPVWAQEQPTSPPWSVLARCADMTDANKELECYRAAMREAGYRRNPERDAAEHRKSFGLELPSIRLGKQTKGSSARGNAQVAQAPGQSPGPASEAQDPNRVVVTISAIAYTRPLNQIMIVTTDGAVWLQDDTISVNFQPKPGDTVKISRTAFGGYFCDFGRSNAVRCIRKN